MFSFRFKSHVILFVFDVNNIDVSYLLALQRYFLWWEIPVVRHPFLSLWHSIRWKHAHNLRAVYIDCVAFPQAARVLVVDYISCSVKIIIWGHINNTGIIILSPLVKVVISIWNFFSARMKKPCIILFV